MKLNYIVNQIAPISRAANIYTQHEHMTCPNGLYWLVVLVYSSKRILLVYNIFYHRNRNKNDLTVICTCYE